MSVSEQSAVEARIEDIYPAEQKYMGDGLHSWKIDAQPRTNRYDPFVCIEVFTMRHPAQYSDHAHRGFESVAYVFEGTFEHKDSIGDHYKIGEGDVLNARMGKGLVHSVAPVGTIVGIDVLVNVSAAERMCEPSVQIGRKKELETITKDGVKMTVIAGNIHGHDPIVKTRTPSVFLDFELRPGANKNVPLEPGWKTIMYVISGAVYVGGICVEASHFSVISTGQYMNLENRYNHSTRFILMSGKPTGEPMFIKRTGYSVFIANTVEQTKEAEDDVRACRNGFENAGDYDIHGF